jgi:hypothetical protein
MLGKKYSLGSTFEATGEQRIKLANFDELKSQGADIASFLESFKPNPGFTYLHVIAMGAGEYYGCNVNGDYFPEKDLIARHHTFVEQAKVFKEHDNKPTSPSFGNVVFSWYNPKMHRVELILALDKIKGEEFIRRQDAGEQLEVSMGCFPAGTLITMADGSQKPIETVAPGESVRTHMGRPRKVVTAMTHRYTGKMYTFTIAATPNIPEHTITATQEHPILVYLDLNTAIDQAEASLDWVDAQNIKLGDRVIQNPYEESSYTVFECGEVTNIAVEDIADTPVYNLSVEEDESFVAENVAVHNCRVRFDVCSICGNKATAKNPYCEHIKYHKREVYPDGKQAYMINVNPTFFDISIVRRRADKIAYVLNKVASTDSAVSLMEKNAELFEHLGSELETSLIPLAPTPDEAIFAIPDNDDMQKIAATLNDREEQEKLAMVKRIRAQAVRVLQKGIEEALPALEKVEPDLPAALLDRMARRHSIEDILHSFFLNAIPMKPREFTRIIIVQNGIPLEKFDDVLAGVRAARPANQIPHGHYQKEIGSLLEKFLIDRSSFLPAVMHRMDKVKTSAVLNMNVPMAYYDLNPNLNFGHVRRPAPYTEINQSIDAIPVYRNSYAQTPVMMSPVQVEEQKLRPKLKEPHMGPVKTGLTLGALYAAYKTHGALDTILKDPKNMALVALLAGLVAQKLDSRKPGGQENGRVKTAGFIKSFGGKIALPFVGVHLLAGHYRNQYNHGKDLNFAERYVAENPDMLSLIAPVAINYALKKHAAIELPDDINYDIPEEYVEKIAEFSDKVSDFANAAVPGIILRGRRHSILSSIVDQVIDQKIINQFTSS